MHILIENFLFSQCIAWNIKIWHKKIVCYIMTPVKYCFIYYVRTSLLLDILCRDCPIIILFTYFMMHQIKLFAFGWQIYIETFNTNSIKIPEYYLQSVHYRQYYMQVSKYKVFAIFCIQTIIFSEWIFKRSTFYSTETTPRNTLLKYISAYIVFNGLIFAL